MANSLGFGPNHDNTIAGNTVTDAGLSGIVIRDSDHNLVQGNTVTGAKGFDLTDVNWGNGISLVNATFNTIDNNTVRNNARNGIFVDATSLGNTIKANTATKNAARQAAILALLQEQAFDYRDNTMGLGTAGTGNLYQNNKGKTQNRPGLIKTFV